MTTITVTKDREGKLTGFGKKDKTAYARFKRVLDKCEPGEIFTIDYWFPRHGKFHRLHFVMMHAIYDAQEQFHNPDHLRDWLTIGAGHAIFLPGPTGKEIAIADSIAYQRLDDDEFAAHHQSVKDFLRSKRATNFLWPHLSDYQQSEMVETILKEFERDDPAR